MILISISYTKATKHAYNLDEFKVINKLHRGPAHRWRVVCLGGAGRTNDVD